MRIPVSLAIAATVAVMAGPASAQFAKPEDAAKYRQGVMFVMSQHVGRLGAMTSGRVPYDARVATENAEIVADMAKLAWAGFGPGYDKVTPSRAKAEIWSEQAKFKEHGEKLIADSTKLVAAAKTNNLDNLKAAFGATAGNCKTCHDAYRRD
ncbi:cytochrome c [Caenimonas sp. SL110]|uniref:c-type cytochrome n=1 Tax=Caenimonas sp. SL110 TaxID=1450524 RepID=UPI000A53CF53|nr:cytochrome c [Caenimonas sp. SL110]